MAAVRRRPTGPPLRLRGILLGAVLVAGCDRADRVLDARIEPDAVEDSALAGLRLDVAGRIPATLEDLRFEGLEDAVSTVDGIRHGGILFSPGGAEGWRWVDPRVGEASGPGDGPAPGSYRGSSAHLLLTGSGRIDLPVSAVVAGMSVALPRRSVPELRKLVPGQGFELPEFRVLVTGFDSTGASVGTVRAIPAVATYTSARVDTGWTWIDTWMLGRVASVRVEVVSPLASSTSVLVDNLAVAAAAKEDPDAFTIALLPDTQKYVENSLLGAQDIFAVQTRWLVRVRDSLKLRFVSHLGDIVEHGDREAEWEVADRDMAPLDGVVPYGIVVGNHDYQEQWDHPEAGSPGFLRHFPARRFAADSTWKAASPDGLSSYQVFPTPLGDFLWLHLSVDSPDPTLPWADSVLAAHPDLPAFVTTHAYLRENGRLPVPYLASASKDAWHGISADSLFRGFVATHPRIAMVTCGHVSAEAHQVSTNRQGSEVHELLQDYQNRPDGGEGFLRLLRFHPAREAISVLTWSPWSRTYEVDANSQFLIPFGNAPWRKGRQAAR